MHVTAMGNWANSGYEEAKYNYYAIIFTISETTVIVHGSERILLPKNWVMV